MSVIDEFDDVRPCSIQFPIARRDDGLVIYLRVFTFQGLQYLIVKTANPEHPKSSRQHPLFVSAGICMPDRILMPDLGCAHGGFQNSPPHLLGSALIAIDLLERVLDVMKRTLGNGYIIRIVESICVRLFQDRPKGNCRPGAQLRWLICTACDRQYHIGQIVVDHGKITRELGGDQAVGFTGSLVSQNPPKRLPGISWPVPWRCVEINFKVHYVFLSIAINHVTPTACAVTNLPPTWYSAQNWCTPLDRRSTRSHA